MKARIWTLTIGCDWDLETGEPDWTVDIEVHPSAGKRAAETIPDAMRSLADKVERDLALSPPARRPGRSTGAG